MSDVPPIHCYALGPIDWWTGAMSRSRMVEAFVASEEGKDWREAIDELQAFENRAMREFRRLGWEGDMREGPYFFAVPDAESMSMAIGVIYKQDNNGQTFIASPVPLPHLKELA